jgi:predicted nucleotidyltransferase component of viral defense system
MNELLPLQKKALDCFKQSALNDKFYWTGGTALSVVYLHHRLSHDIDLFTTNEFSRTELDDFIGSLKNECGLGKIEERKIHDRHEFFLHNGDELRLEFARYNFPALKDREEWQGIAVDSLDDIATNKIAALVDRNEPKDAFDVYMLFEEGGYDISTLLSFVEKKFGVRYEESTLWGEALRSAGELESLIPLMINADVDPREQIKNVKLYFEERSRSFLESHLA